LKKKTEEKHSKVAEGEVEEEGRRRSTARDKRSIQEEEALLTP
jgi:hypothetical protein